jgi:hypothetical protein
LILFMIQIGYLIIILFIQNNIERIFEYMYSYQILFIILIFEI